MHIEDTDLFLIEDTRGDSFKIAALKFKQNLAANAFNNYKLLVNKPDYTSRFVYAQNMQASVAPTDYMLVERAGVSYKVTGDHIIDYFPSVPAGAAGAIVDVGNITIDGAWEASNVFPNSSVPRSVTYGGGKFLTTCMSSVSFHSSDGINWTFSEILPTGNTFEATAYGDGKFVTVSSEANGIGRYSTDGAVTWSDCTGVKNYSYRGMTYGNGLFVAVHQNINERPSISTDGIAWTEAISNNSGKMNAVTYGNGLYVAVGQDNCLMTSSDGNTWTSTTNQLPQGDWKGIAYGAGKWVTVNNVSQVAYSDDNTNTWQTVPNVPNGSYRDVVYANGLFVAASAGGSNSIAYSENGVNWFSGDDTDLNSWASITYGGDKFVAISQSSSPGYALYSLTGTGEEAYSSELTLASDTNLDLFTVGDAISMVDSDGDVASYTPVTSAITNVVTETEASFTTTSTNTPELALDGDYTTFGYSSNQNNMTFSNTTVKPGESFWAYIGKKSTDSFSYTLSTTDGNKSFNPGSGGTNIYLIYTNKTSSNVTINSAQANRSGGPVYVSAYAITPPNFYTVDPILEADGNDILGPYTIFKIVPTRTLTFTSPNQDLKFFNPGDVVQEIPGYITPTADRLAESESYTYAYNGNNMTQPCNYAAFFDGDYNTGGIMTAKNNRQTFRVACVMSQPEFVDDDIWTKKPVMQNIRYRYAYARFVMPDGSTQEVRGGESATGPAGETGGAGWFVIRNRPSDFIDLCFIEFTNEQTGSVVNLPFYGWAIGTRGITLDPYSLLPVSVVSTDTAANTMTVDGGTWSNGEVVNTPAKSGIGNFAGNTGAVVDVTNSNQKWISNDNRLGEQFFIKSASTRTGLAIIRAKAASLASTFNLTTTYNTGDVVLYDDCYWVRDNGSWLKISEPTTTY